MPAAIPTAGGTDSGNATGTAASIVGPRRAGDRPRDRRRVSWPTARGRRLAAGTARAVLLVSGRYRFRNGSGT